MARAQLILDLERDLGVNREGIGIILSLLDQVHGLRQMGESGLHVQGRARLQQSRFRRH
jgi:chaperone modulatory protein CbpM